MLGPFVKRKVLNDAPLDRNMPTDPSIRVTDPKDFDAEKSRLRSLLLRVAAGGAAAMTRHPHPFFGYLTPREWGLLQGKHINHHFQQFDV